MFHLYYIKDMFLGTTEEFTHAFYVGANGNYWSMHQDINLGLMLEFLKMKEEDGCGFVFETEEGMKEFIKNTSDEWFNDTLESMFEPKYENDTCD